MLYSEDTRAEPWVAARYFINIYNLYVLMLLSNFITRYVVLVSIVNVIIQQKRSIYQDSIIDRSANIRKTKQNVKKYS